MTVTQFQWTLDRFLKGGHVTTQWEWTHPRFADLCDYDGGWHGQQHEDRRIVDVLDRIGTTNRCAFEFGAADGIWISNTRRLWEMGWEVFLMDANGNEIRKAQDRNEERVHAVEAMVTPSNVDMLLSVMGCPAVPDFGCIDIDGQDWWVWRGMEAIRPRVLMIEVCGSMSSDSSKTPHERHMYVPPLGAQTGQAAREPMILLGIEKGYRLVGMNEINLLFVDKELSDG